MKNNALSAYPAEFMDDDILDIDVETLNMDIYGEDDPESRYCIATSDHTTPEEAAIDAHAYRQIVASVERLRQPTRYILERFYGINCEPMTQKDIAAEMQRSQSQISVRLTQGRLLLQAMYRGDW